MAQIQQLKGQAVKPRHPETGRFALGDPKGEYKPGKETDYFRVRFNPDRGFNLPLLMEYWHDVYGEKPTSLNEVYFLGATSDSEDVLTSAMETWGKSANGTPVCTLRCNGVQIERQLQEGKFSFDPSPCRFPNCTGKTTKDGKPISCQLNARLKVWLPDFIRQTGIMGYFMLTMHGKQSYENVLGALQPFDSVPGGLIGKAFRLYRYASTGVTPDGGTATHYLVNLEHVPTTPQLSTGSSDHIQIEAPVITPAPELPAGNGNGRAKAWYTFPDAIDRVLKETGLPPGKAAAKLGLTLDDFQSDRDLITLWRKEL